jgi:hypothetical protein
MQTPLGNVSTKKAPGMQHKRYMRMEKLVRLELSGYTEDEMAFHQQITKVRVNQIKRTPEYIALRTSLASGLVSEADRNMLEDLNDNHQVLREMVPEALLAVRDAILDKNNPALRLRAAQDLLDREGTLAKVSKTEVKTRVEYDYDQHDKVAGSLLDALKDTESKRGSAPTLEDLGLDEFASANLDKEGQNKLQEAFNLIDNFTSTDPNATIN